MPGTRPGMTTRWVLTISFDYWPLLVARLQIALAVITALGAPWRAVAVGLGLVAGARLLAAGALHQHAAALAVGDQSALAGRLERLFLARCSSIVTLG